MNTCRIYFILLFACIMICSSKEGIGQQRRFDGSVYKYTFIPDSLKTPEQKELELKWLRVYHTHIQFRGDSIAFLLDKEGFLSEGLPEKAYLETVEVLRQYNEAFRNAKPHIRKILLSTQATDNAVMLKFFGYEYSGEVPLLEYEGIKYDGPGGTPSIVNMKNSIILLPVFPPDYVVFPPGVPIDTIKAVPK